MTWPRFWGSAHAAASKTVDRLVRQKCLRRSVGQSDRRRTHLSLAAAGRKVLVQYDTSKDRALAIVFRDLDGDEVRRTTEFLEALTRGIVNGSVNAEEVCLQCGIYLRKRCVVREAARADCQYQRRRKSRGRAPEPPTRTGPKVASRS